MSIIKRISTTLFSKIDHVVGEIENHDALIQATIKEQRKKIAAAKVQHARLQGAQQRIQEQISQLTAEERQWAERAIKEAERDPSQAMACMQRRQQAQNQIKQLGQSRDEYQKAAEKMAQDLSHSDSDLRSMKQKHELLRSRQTSADALTVISDMDHTHTDELESSFDRWEIKISQAEIMADSYEPVDTLEQAYINEENQQALSIELEELIAKEKSNDNA
ncbi:MAG: hypothetical protein GY814_03040 [Gammaproteobacteria bacterium]|nr:hypothetical protein [Gammaproteobacteria bacterium]